MLVNWQAPDKVYLVCGKTDLRKGIDGLAMVIAENYGLELYSNSLFLFCGSRNDRFKARQIVKFKLNIKWTEKPIKVFNGVTTTFH